VYDIKNQTTSNDVLTKNQNFSYRLAGDIFNDNITIENIYSSVKNQKKINLEGEFNLLLNDVDSIIFLNDELGCIKWFYHLDDERFIVSNDFWSIVKEIKATSSDINPEALYEILILGMPLENKTWINDIEVFPRGVIASFDKKSLQLVINEEYSINYT